MISFFSCTGKASPTKTQQNDSFYTTSYRYYSQQIHTFSHAAKYETF